MDIGIMNMDIWKDAREVSYGMRKSQMKNTIVNFDNSSVDVG